MCKIRTVRVGRYAVPYRTQYRTVGRYGEGDGEGEGEGESIILPLLLIPSWALAIAYRLPIDCLLLALQPQGPNERSFFDKSASGGERAKQSIGNRQAIARAQEGINSKGNIIDIWDPI